MLLKNVLKDLIDNELVNLAIGKPQWSNATFSYTRLINCISMAYLELHKRFPLKKEIVTLIPLEDRTNYPLSLEFAVSNTASTSDKFIIDTAEDPFSDKVVKIDNIQDVNGCPIDFNTTKLTDNIILSGDKTLIIKAPDITQVYTLTCRTLPEPIILVNEAELDTYELELPSTYYEALLCYAAGRVYINRGAENTTNNESAIFFARFEASCTNILVLGLSNQENLSNNKLYNRGFV